MPSKTLTEQTPPETQAEWQTAPERAPSELLDKEPRFARLVGTCALACVFVGAAVLFLWQIGSASRLSPGWGAFLCVAGLAGLLFHAASDPDLQIRRIYLIVGFAWLGLGVIVTIWPIPAVGSLFLPWGYLFLALSLLFLVPAMRHETDPTWQQAAQGALGVGGVVMALAGLVGGNIGTFLLPYGFLLAMLGLAFWWAFVALRGTADNLGYRAGVAMGVLGLLILVVALVRSVGPSLLYGLGWSAVRPVESYFASAGMVLSVLGLAYLGVSLGLVSDHPIAVLTRRELMSFFYSPIAYIVIFGSLVIGLVQSVLFVSYMVNAAQRSHLAVPEPIVRIFFSSGFPIVVVLFAVPILTMRLFSEEKRSGTLEVLLTAPLSEAAIVVSKFLAAFLFYLTIWLPWVLYLVGLRIIGQEPFDYQPALSFFIALACSGVGFVAMGLFFSSLTRNQVAASVLTFMGMIVLMGAFWMAGSLPEDSALRTVLGYINFLELWRNSLSGILPIRELLFHVSLGVFWLFLTAKVLEARKWS